MSSKTINVQNILDEANRLLGLKGLSRDEKRGVCSMIEHVLRVSDNYNGFNDNYWLSVGCQQWHDNGEPALPEKNKYIYGPLGKQNEYSRTYYSK